MRSFVAPRWSTKPLLGAALDWSHPLTRGLVVAIVFNEGSGSLVRNLARPGNATAADPAWTSTVDGTLGFNFNDVTDRKVTVPHESAINVGINLTIVTRVMVVDTSSGDQCVCAKGAGAYEIDIVSGQVRFNRDGQASFIQASMSGSTALQQIAARVEENENRLYLDAAEVGSHINAGLSDTSTDLHIGSNPADSAKVLNGIMADFYLWNRPLPVESLRWLLREPYTMLQRPPAVVLDAPAGEFQGHPTFNLRRRALRPAAFRPGLAR